MIFKSDNNQSFLYNSNVQRKYQIEPFVRYSISKKTDRFFYVELFSAITGGNNKEMERLTDGNYGYYEIVDSDFTDITLGPAIGYKFYIKQRLCMDFNLGFGSNLYQKISSEAVPKFAISTGYRF